MAVVTLTQSDEDSLKGEPLFAKYFVDQIITQVRHNIGLSDFPSTQEAINYVHSLAIKSNPQLPGSDPNLVAFMLIRMAVRGLNKLDNSSGTTITDKTILFLNTGGNVGYLIADWFAEKTKVYL